MAPLERRQESESEREERGERGDGGPLMLTASGLRDGASFLACQRLPAGFRLHGSKCADSAGSKGNGYFWLSKRSQTEREARGRGEAIRCTSAALLCAGDSAVEELEMDGWDQKRRLDEYSEI